MARNPDDVFNIASADTFSDNSADTFATDKAVNVFKTAADKAQKLDPGSKKRGLGMRTESNATLETAINQLKDDYRTNPNSLLSDKEAQEGIGQVLNIIGAANAGLGKLEGDILNIPDALNTLNDSASAVLSTALRKIPGYSDLIDNINAIEIEQTTVGEAATRFGELVDDVTGEVAQVGDFVEEEASRTYNTARTEEMQKELGIEFDNAEGFWDGATRMAKVVAQDPIASGEMFANSLPQMMALTSKSTQATAFLGATADRIKESTEGFIERNGREPEGTEMATIVSTSIAQSIIDVGASKVVLGKKLSNTSENILGKAADVIKGTKVGKVVSKVPGVKGTTRIGGAAVAEGLEEGTQTYLSEFGARQDATILDKDVAKEAAIATAAGAGAGGVGRSGTAVKDTAKDVIDLAKTTGKGAKKVASKIGGKAKGALNVSTDIAKVVAKEGNFAGAVAAAQRGTPRDIINTVADVDLTELGPEDRRTILNPLVDAENALRKEIQEMAKDDPDRQGKLQELKQIDARNRAMIEVHNKMRDEEAGIEVDEKIPEDATPEEAQEIIGRKFGSAGFRSDLDEKKAKELLNDQMFEKYASPEEKQELELIIDRYAKTAENVSAEILQGDEFGLFKGVHEYLGDLDSAVSLGNKTKAAEAVSNIEAFARRQTKKANMILSAAGKIKADPDISLADNLSAQEVDAKLGTKYSEFLGPNFKFEQRTPQFVKSTIIGKDLKAINAALAEATFRFNNEYAKAPVKAPKETKQETEAKTPVQEKKPEEAAETPPKTTKESSLSAAISETKAAEQKADRRTETKDIKKERRQSERRSEEAFREEAKGLTREELEEAYTRLQRDRVINELTGINNRRAFEEDLDEANVVVSIDADSLKWVNDNVSPQHGDELLIAVAKAVKKFAGERAYHISGDEYYVLADTTQEAEAIMEQVDAYLAKAIITATKPDGTVITLNGLNATYGVAKDRGTADAKLKAEKIAREKRGERAERGEQPLGTTITPAKGDKTESTTTKIEGEQDARTTRQPATDNTERQAKTKPVKKLPPEYTGEYILENDSFEALKELGGELITAVSPIKNKYKENTDRIDELGTERKAVVKKLGNEDTGKLLTVIASLGGMFPESEESDLLRPKGSVKRAANGRSSLVFKSRTRKYAKEGMEIDAMLEALNELGFEFDTIVDLQDAIDNALEGNEIVSSDTADVHFELENIDAEVDSLEAANQQLAADIDALIAEQDTTEVVDLNAIQNEIDATVEQTQTKQTYPDNVAPVQNEEITVDPDESMVQAAPDKTKSIPDADSVLGDRLLVNGVTDPDTKTTAKDFLQASKQKAGGLINIVNNFLFHYNDPRIQERIPNTVNKQSLNTTMDFVNDFVNRIQGKDSLLRMLKIQKVSGKIQFAKGSKKSDFDLNPMAYLIQEAKDGTLVLNNNLLTIMGLVSNNWLATQASRTLFNDKESINVILGRPKGTEVEPSEINELAEVGFSRTTIAEQLGTQVFQRLGLEIKPGVDGMFQSRLEESIGQLMLEVMVRQGHLTNSKVDIGLMKGFAGQPKTNFVRIAVDNTSEDLVVAPATDLIIGASRDSQEATNSFIELPNRIVAPSFEPSDETYEGKKQKGTIQDISDYQKKVFRKMNKVPYGFKSNMTALTDFLGIDELRKHLGYNFDLDKVNAGDLKSVKGKNLEIDRTLKYALDFINDNRDNLDKPFYFEHYAMKQTRFDNNSNTVTMSGNKTHRFIFGLKNAEIEVDPQNFDQMVQFAYAVALSFGKPVDKQPGEASLNDFRKLMTDEDIQAGVRAVAAIESGEKISKVEEITHKAAIAKAIELGGEGMHTLNALSAMAQYTTDGKFTHNLPTESDGRQSGPTILNVQTLAEDTAIDDIASGGIHIDGSTDHGTYAEQTTKKDIYEKLATAWREQVSFLFDDNETARRIAKGAEYLIGTMNEAGELVAEINRNMAKNPVTVTNFGASIEATREAFTKSMLKHLYADLTKYRNNPAELKRISEALNMILGYSDGSINITKATAQNVLPAKLEKQFKAAVDSTYGMALEAALSAQVEKVNKIRNVWNTAFQVMHRAFQIRYETRMKEEIKKNNGKPINREAELKLVEELQKFMAIVRTPFSNHEYKDGIVSMKRSHEPDYENGTVQVEFSTPRPGDKAKSVTGHGSKVVYNNGGVGGVIGMIHSIDSAVQQRMLNSFDALNLFDAGLYNTNDVIAGTNLANQAFHEINNEFSVGREISESFNRIFTELSKNHPNEFSTIVNTSDKDKNDPRLVARQLLEIAEDTEQRKSDLLNDPQISVEQYGYPGTSYQPTPPATNTTEQSKQDFFNDIEPIIKDIGKDIDDQMNSSPEGIDLGLFDSVNGDPLTSDNAIDIFDQIEILGTKKEDSGHSNYLRGLMESLIQKGLEPLNELNIKFRATGNTTVGAVADVKKGNKVTPTVFVASSIGTKGNPVQMSAQEVYSHELIHMITRFALDDPNNFALRNQIQKIFEEAKKVATIDLFLPEQGPHDAETLRAARLRYNYIFNNKNSHTETTLDEIGHKIYNRRNDYLHEFVAFGMTNAKMRDLLNQVDTRDIRKKTIWGRMQAWWNSVLDWLSGRVSGVDSLQGDEALTLLVHRLTELHEGKRKSILDHIGISAEINQKLGAALRKVIWQPMTAFQQKYPEPANWNIPHKVYNGTVAAINHPEEFGKALNQVRKRIGWTEENFFVSLVREHVGNTPAITKFHTLLRLSKKWIDQERKHVSEDVASLVKDAFIEGYDENESKSLNRAITKTDLVSLIDNGFTPDQLADLLADDKKLQAAIAKAESDLSAYPNEAGYYADQAIGLGRYMATGQTHIDGQSLSTHLIASLGAVDSRQTITSDIADRSAKVDVLASLFALHYTKRGDRAAVAQIIRREYESNPEMNGIVNLFNMHRLYKQDALRSNFNNNPNLMIKGYTVETFNPAIDIKPVVLETSPAALRDQLEELAQAGYVKVDGELAKDIKDPNQKNAVLYIRNDPTSNTWLKSIAGLTAERVKGATLATAYINEGTQGANTQALIDRNIVKAREDRFVARQFGVPTANRNGDTNKLVPVRNELGKTVGYRYLMSEAMKQRLLEKDDNFSAVMGRMHGNVVDKKNTKQVNQKLVDLNKEDFDDNFAKDPSAFVEVSHRSTDPRLKEIYDLLPEDTKLYIKTKYPQGRMWVRESLLDLQFGYRKFSVSNTAVGKFLNEVFNAFLPGSQYKNLVGNAEQLWQGVVGMAKDFIVIKSGVVLAGNVMSNEMLLLAKGVPLGTSFQDQAKALRALDAFMGQVKEERAIKRELASSTTLSKAKRDKMEVRLAQLADSLAANPVKSLIDEGIFQSIAEDIAENDLNDQYSTKNKLAKQFNEKFPRAEKFVDDNANVLLQTYKHGYFTHDTQPYKLLLRGTQYSDFIARYSLYQHHINSGMAHDAALADIIETFINYDIPTSKFMQYMNDMGIMLFTKFLFRIQKVIIKSMKGKPANNLALYSLQSVLGDASDIPDQFILTHGLIFSLPDIVENATNIAAAEIAQDSLDGASSFLE